MKSSKKVDTKKLITRIVAWVLIVMTVVTTFYTAIYFIMMSVNAAETDDISVAVGILYGSDVDVGLTASTTNGFKVGSEKIGKYKKTYTDLWSLSGYKKVTVLCDKNYELKGTSYKVTSTPNVGAYRLDLGKTYSSESELKTAISSVDAVISGAGYYSIPAYINGTYRLRIGGFLTENDAADALATVQALLPDYKLSVKKPTATGTFAVEHATAKVLFEYDCGTESYLAFDAINNADGSEAYLTTYNGNLYDGLFVYKRYTSGSVDGIELLTVLPLEDYVAGVLPYEISASWPLETQKAFAIVVRTFVIDQIGKHWNQYGFNVCATSNCQVYGGVGRVNNTVRNAVKSTAGMVVAYNNKLAYMYYCSSVGNGTADIAKVWGSSVAWLSGVETPWEDYLNHSNAFWTVEVSPTDLCKYLNSQGYTSLKGAIAKITIDETASANSTYVSKMTITDTSGNSVTVSRCDKVRSALTKYVKSANFVVGRGSVTYTKYTKTVPPGTSTGGVENSLFSVITGSGKLSFDFSSGVNVITGSGTQSYTPDGSVSVITADGVLTADTKTGSSYIVTDTKTASDPDNFIFVGKGWGHGVGLSQWGLRDLADMGISYDAMIQAYCPGVTIGNYKKYVSY